MKFSSALLLLCVLTPAAQAAEPVQDKARAVIADMQRVVTPRGIQENYTLEIGGIPQWVYVRGQDRENPILLFVHGGPAAPIQPTAWQFQRPLAEYFTVVNWDQRGAGRTYLASRPEDVAPTLVVDRYVDDIIELTEHLRTRYHKRKVILVAHSWGTIIGLKAAAKRPDLFHAYVGAGQVIDGHANEAISFDYGMKRAKADNNLAAIKEMETIAPYPGNQPITRDRVIVARKWPQHYGGLTAYRSDSNYYYRGGQLSPEYAPADLAAVDKGSVLTVDRVMDAVLNANLQTVREMKVPVVMFYGRHDYTTPTAPVAKWMAELQAPLKREVWFEHSAHMMFWEEPGKLLLSLVEQVRPLAVEQP